MENADPRASAVYMQSEPTDRISRGELAKVLKAAAERQALLPADESMSLTEAERIAAEVGIDRSDFRSALSSIRSAQSAKSGFFGPHGVLSAETMIGHRVRPDDAVQMLAQAQLPIASVGGDIDTPAPGVWRLSSRSALLQVATVGDRTTIGVASSRRVAKSGLISGGALIGMMTGAIVLPGLAFATGPTIESLALANIVGILGGAASGLGAGWISWRIVARRGQERVAAAVERMRAVAGSAARNTEESE